jgi:hypothetical protein
MSRRSHSSSIAEGTVEPSDQAYVDAFLHPIGINRNNISVNTVKEQRNESNGHDDDDDDGSSLCTVFHHELLYKGDVCWRLETKNMGDHQYSSKCDIVKGQLVIKTKSITKRKWFGKSRKIKTTEHDVADIIQGAAIAYHSDAAEEELGLIDGEIDPLLSIQILDDNYDTKDESTLGDVESSMAESVLDGILEQRASSCLRNQDATRAKCKYFVDKDDALVQQMQMAKQQRYAGLGGLTCV